MSFDVEFSGARAVDDGGLGFAALMAGDGVLELEDFVFFGAVPDNGAEDDGVVLLVSCERREGGDCSVFTSLSFVLSD